MKINAILLVALFMAGCQVKTTPQPEKASSDSTSAPAPHTGLDIKALFLSGTDQAEFSLAAYRGKVLLLDFWATWSAPALAEIPALTSIAHELQDQGVALVGMAVDRGDRSQVTESVRTLGLSFPVAWADENVQKAFGGIRAVPTKVLVDKKGNIRKHLPGAVTEAALRDEIRALVAEN